MVKKPNVVYVVKYSFFCTPTGQIVDEYKISVPCSKMFEIGRYLWSRSSMLFYVVKYSFLVLGLVKLQTSTKFLYLLQSNLLPQVLRHFYTKNVVQYSMGYLSLDIGPQFSSFCIFFLAVSSKAHCGLHLNSVALVHTTFFSSNTDQALRQNPSKHKSLHRKKPLAKSLQRKIPPSKMPPHLKTSQQNTSRHNATKQNAYNLEKAYVQI